MIKNFLRWLITPINKRYYDITRPSRHMDNHFSGIDGADADSLIETSLETARNRARYEVRNNCYAYGIIATLANDVVGTGPSIQVKSGNEAFDRSVERRFAQWAETCDAAGRQSFDDMLRLAFMQLCESGEAIWTHGAAAGSADGAALRLLMIEPDRVNTPWDYTGDTGVVMGIRIDTLGRPLEYYVQKNHPGNTRTSAAVEYDTVPADKILHLARLDRPGQTRGMPWLTPALPLFAHLRRYTLSVVSAAEKAADLAAVVESDMPVGGAVDANEFETIDIERGSMLTLPAGWKMNQFKAEQPTDTYATFKAEIINEMARCLGMPLNIAAANSANYNYASGRLDYQTYYRNLTVLRGWMQKRILNRVFELWFAEASLINGYFDGDGQIERIDWYWPGAEHVDPQKESNAQDTRLKNFSTTYAAEYARQGKDWTAELEQVAREQKLMKQLGIEMKDVQNATQPKDQETEETDDDEDDDAETLRAVG